MRVIDVLSAVREETTVYVSDVCDNFVAVYDGKNSIPSKYNNASVINIEPLDYKTISLQTDIVQ